MSDVNETDKIQKRRSRKKDLDKSNRRKSTRKSAKIDDKKLKRHSKREKKKEKKNDESIKTSSTSTEKDKKEKTLSSKERRLKRKQLAASTQNVIENLLKQEEEEQEKEPEEDKLVDEKPKDKKPKESLDNFLFPAGSDDEDDDVDYDDDEDDEDDEDDNKAKKKEETKKEAKTEALKDVAQKKEEKNESDDNKDEVINDNDKNLIDSVSNKLDKTDKVKNNDNDEDNKEKKKEDTNNDKKEDNNDKDKKDLNNSETSKEMLNNKECESNKKESSKTSAKKNKNKTNTKDKKRKLSQKAKRKGSITIERETRQKSSLNLEERKPVNKSTRSRSHTTTIFPPSFMSTENLFGVSKKNKINQDPKERLESMINLLFNKLKIDDILPEPFLTAKKLFDSGESINIIEKSFEDYEKKKNIISLDTSDDLDDDDIDNLEPSEEDIEEPNLPKDEYIKDPNTIIEYNDNWNIANAGGCFNYQSWRKNPQYLLYIEKTSQIELSVSQPNDNEIPLHIGFYIFYGNSQGKRVIAKEELIDKCPLEDENIVGKIIKLGGSSDPYVVVPCTFDPNEFSNFNIKASLIGTGPKFKFHRLLKSNDWVKNIIKGRWKKSLKNSGGCRNYHNTHLNNDQFLISVAKNKTTNSYVGQRCSGKVLLQYRHKENVDELGIYILSAPKGLSHKVIHIFDAPLLVKSGFSLPNEALCDFRFDNPEEDIIIIPCTFEPEKYASYKLTIFSDIPVDIKPLQAPIYKEIKGEWKGNTAVGCLNHPSWRYNPQYSITTNGKTQIQLQKLDEKNDTVIGFYVLKSNGERQLEVNKDNFVTKASFMNSISVTATVTVENNQIIDGKITPSCFTVVPCSFRPGNEAQFSIRTFSNNSTSILELEEAKDEWKETVVSGKWAKGTAGGCINYASWKNNPQIRLTAEKDGEIILALEQEHNNESIPISIGFYVVEKPTNNERTWIMEPENIIHKAPFRKNNLNMSRMKIKKGKEYNIIPCSFSPWNESSFKFYAYGYQQTIKLKKLHRTKNERSLRVKGKWTKNSCGGCMANASWPKNPHLLLEVNEKPVSLEIMLQQSLGKDDNPPAIGFCITKSDGHGFPSISSVDDILYKVNYEEAMDISMTAVIPPSKIPYVITPSTYHPDIRNRFALQIFTNSSSNITLRDPHHYFESGEDDFDILVNEDIISSSSNITSAPKVTEKIEEIMEDEENLQEQVLPSSSSSTSNILTTNETTQNTSNSNNDNKKDIPNAPPINLPKAPPLNIQTNKPLSQTTNIKTSSNANEGISIFDQIKKGKTLKTADQQKPIIKTPEFSFTPFNIDKIVARRAALEFSDDEASADEWDDWDDSED